MVVLDVVVDGYRGGWNGEQWTRAMVVVVVVGRVDDMSGGEVVSYGVWCMAEMVDLCRCKYQWWAG